MARTAYGDAYRFFQAQTRAPLRDHKRSQELARAELYAREQGWEFRWDNDEDGWYEAAEWARDNGRDVETCEVCDLVDEDGNLLESLGGIWDASQEYRRHVQADLALEAMHTHQRANMTPPAHWLTPTGLALLKGILIDKAADRLPILADCMDESGCDDTKLLAWMRRGQAGGADWKESMELLYRCMAVAYYGRVPGDRIVTSEGAAYYVDDFTMAYIEAALWSSNDESTPEGGEPMDRNYGAEDIHPATINQMIEDCVRFQKENAEDLDPENYEGPLQDNTGNTWTEEEAGGHDFWLTRSGSGAGFGDGDWQEPQDTRLHDAASAYGEMWLYIGDDGLIHGS